MGDWPAWAAYEIARRKLVSPVRVAASTARIVQELTREVTVTSVGTTSGHSFP